jgi:hypothetical protein
VEWRFLTPGGLKTLEDENTKLKKLLAGAVLDNGHHFLAATSRNMARRSPPPGLPGEPVAGMPGDWCGPQLNPLSLPAAG